MKSTFFNKPLEFSINIDGDNWKQGDSISGDVKISSHSSDPINFDQYGIFLCEGNSKKIKAKDPKGFEILEQLLFSNSDSNKFSFPLSSNSSITEKASGPYIVCAHKENLLEGQHLVMQVAPSENISNIIEIFENYLRFKVKSIKSKKNALEYTFKVPTSKEYLSIVSFKILTSFDEKVLNLDYQLKIKKVVFENSITTTKDELKSFKYSLSPKDYLFYGDSIDQDKMNKHFNEVLDLVKVRPII